MTSIVGGIIWDKQSDSLSQKNSISGKDSPQKKYTTNIRIYFSLCVNRKIDLAKCL